MHYTMDWQITIGRYQLALLDSVEIVKSVDALADTCQIVLPLYAYNQALRVEQQLKRGDSVTVLLGYDGKLVREFEGFLLAITTDDGHLKLTCEDGLYLLRKPIPNKQLLGAAVADVAAYVLANTNSSIALNCGLKAPGFYEKFVVDKATGYDVLKKLQDETKANIYMRWLATQGQWQLNIHPLYAQQHGQVKLSLQHNVEQAALSYKMADDKKLEVVVTNTGPNGKKRSQRYGTTGGDKLELEAHGLSPEAMAQRAKSQHLQNVYDGYEGDLTTWLIPVVEPGYSVEVIDEDFEYKNGRYYAKAVTTSFSKDGGSRKIELGIKLQ
ncbi:MAG: hypothetical protein EAY75_15025 [Bacteroidetes bacterium]|nr:MAG: hypothetical protein EAY75_15025 [Bacteroidota bacterium]